MGSRVVTGRDTVHPSSDNLAVAGNDGSKRAAPVVYILFREPDGLAHKFFVCHIESVRFISIHKDNK